MTVESIHIYPVKGLGGYAVTEAEVESRGLKFDRRWMVIDEDGQFLSQRELAPMARIRCRVEADQLNFSTVEGASLVIPATFTGSETQATVWKSTVRANLVSDPADRWLSDVLGRSCRLVALPDDSHRILPRADTQEDYTVSFADGYPILVIGTASLEDLNRRLESPIPMNRFRPNIVVLTDEPFVEDTCSKIRINQVEMSLVKRCARCLVTTTDQETGERGIEPLRTLATFRNIDQKLMFGMNAVPEILGRISLGDSVIPA